jgi:hypothetical protein
MNVARYSVVAKLAVATVVAEYADIAQANIFLVLVEIAFVKADINPAVPDVFLILSVVAAVQEEQFVPTELALALLIIPRHVPAVILSLMTVAETRNQQRLAAPIIHVIPVPERQLAFVPADTNFAVPSALQILPAVPLAPADRFAKEELAVFAKLELNGAIPVIIAFQLTHVVLAALRRRLIVTTELPALASPDKNGAVLIIRVFQILNVAQVVQVEWSVLTELPALVLLDENGAIPVVIAFQFPHVVLPALRQRLIATTELPALASLDKNGAVLIIRVFQILNVAVVPTENPAIMDSASVPAQAEEIAIMMAPANVLEFAEQHGTTMVAVRQFRLLTRHKDYAAT